MASQPGFYGVGELPILPSGLGFFQKKCGFKKNGFSKKNGFLYKNNFKNKYLIEKYFKKFKITFN